MSDRFLTIIVFTLIGSACFAIAALPHISAYTALVSWTVNLIG